MARCVRAFPPEVGRSRTLGRLTRRRCGVFPVGMSAPGAPTPRSRRATIAVVIAAVVGVAIGVAFAIVISRGPDIEPLGVSSRLQSLETVTLTGPEHAEHPELALISAMAPWRALEPTDDEFDWTELEADVTDARDHGYRLILRIMAGRAAPPWLGTSGVQTVQLYGSDPNAFDFCEPIEVPVPWDPVLEREYGELLTELGAWLRGSDGAGGMRADHVAIVTIAMPAILGSEMTISYGPPGICPDDTSAAGLDLRTVNRDAWDGFADEEDRRRLLEGAWREAIEIHMSALPEVTASAIAFGHLFDDEQAAAQRIAGDEVAAYRERLWSMYTNLQPETRPDGSLGPWSEVCPRCAEVLATAADAGGGIGFQLASTTVMDTQQELAAAIYGVLDAYPVGFLEAQPGAIDAYAGFLLDGSGSAQARILQR